MENSGGNFARGSVFMRCAPASVALFFAIGAFGVFLFSSPLVTLAALAGAALSCIYICGARRTLAAAGFILPLWCFALFGGAIFSPRGDTLLLSLPFGGRLTLEGLCYTSVTAAGVLALTLFLMLCDACLGSARLRGLLSRALPATALALSASLSFLPRLRRDFSAAAETQALLLPEKRKLFDRLRARSRLLGRVCALSLEDTLVTAAAMRGRGYGLGGASRPLRARGSMAPLVAVLIFAAAAAGALGFGEGGAAYYPSLAVPLSGWTSALAVLFFIYYALPFFAAAAEELKCRFSK